MYKFTPELPTVLRSPEDIDSLIGKVIGNDLEWNQREEPTVLGLSDGVRTVSVPFEAGVERFKALINEPGITWVGHNIVAADLLVLERMGIRLPLDRIDDTIIWMWLVNMHLAKASGKTALEEDHDEKRGRGFFNLGTMLSVYTDIWHYKDCRGPGCNGPCPEHDKYGYNGIDALGPVLALPALKRQAQLRGVDKLYPMHRELAYVLAQMQSYGVRIDVPYVYGRDRHPLGSDHGNSLDEQFRREKEEIAATLPFNPKSPKEVIAYFKTKDITLENAQEETIREVVEEYGEEGAPDELIALLDYKELGNGCDRWFEPQYRDKNGWLQGYLDPEGFVHPRLNFFTSSARLACSSPNFQNVAKRRSSRKVCICGALKDQHPTPTCAKFKGELLGKKVRKAIIAPEGWYIVRADLSNAENRVALHFGGYTIERGKDLHAWVKDIAGITEDMEISLREGSAREAAKKIQHANNNLEGLQLKAIEELQRPKMKAEIAAGARKVHWDWRFRNRIITFSGAYEAKRTFGSATWENRKKVLEVNEKYTAAFPGVIDFRKRVSKACEVEGAVRGPLGYVLLSFGDDNDRMKIAQSNWQQCPVAHVTKIALLRLWKRWEKEHLMRPVLQVHDEIIAYVRDSVPPDVAGRWLVEAMEVEMEQIPGLLIPADPSYGPNWRDQTKLS